MSKLLTKLLGDPNAREIKRLRGIVDKVNQQEAKISALTDDQLRDQTASLRARYEKGEKLDALLPEAFATVREAAKRVIGQRHYDVQLMGGVTLHEGKIAEMRTGEGKTLVATAPSYLNAISGKGVHVVTVNDYLARRDAGWMAQIYHSLGITTGVIVHEQGLLYDPEYNDGSNDERLMHLRPVSRKEAYAADVTYGTNNEFGFDYLRDNMVDDLAKMVQRPLNFAIVDEVDSILIDEARTPLIISQPAEESTNKYSQFAQIARRLKRDHDYTVDEKMRAVSLTDEGIVALEKALGVDNVYEAGMVEEVHHVEQSLKAEAIFTKDKDYVVNNGEIIIVDEFTGRLMPGRRYSEGLHQAIEAKEGVEVRRESVTYATVTFQNYFRLYETLSGMTGTAATEAEEFTKIYKLDVTEIPTHNPIQRIDHPDRIYKTELGKFKAVAAEVKERHAAGQPVLLGTVSIAKNELLSSLLTQYGVPHQILNAKNNETEAGIVASAGQKGAVTLATNIAGRGTDIVLGEGVRELGGLYVIGTERHESRRIDNQLRGRSGRQGDPGATRFYVSLEDDLMRIFGGDRIQGLMGALGLDDETPIENNSISKSLENAQKKVEGHNFDARKQTVEYDDVMNRHREVIYARRRRALSSEDLRPEIEAMLEGEFKQLAEAHTDATTGIVDMEKVVQTASTIMPLSPELIAQLEAADPRDVADLLGESSKVLYTQRKETFGEDLRILERLVYLRVLDTLWIEHLEAMEGLREGIGLRQIAQRDPLVEYKLEAYRLFQRLINLMEAEIASTFFRYSIERSDAIVDEPVETAITRAQDTLRTNNPDVGVGQAASSDTSGVSRAERRAAGKSAKKSNATKKKAKKRK